MRGDISHLLIIQIINDGFVSLAGKEKGKITNGDRKKRCAEKGNFVLELIRFVLYMLYIIFCFFVKFVHILTYAQI